MKDSHTLSDKQSLMNQVVEIIDYINNQRIFLIGKPKVSLFNSLICGYTHKTIGELIKEKINKDKND